MNATAQRVVAAALLLAAGIMSLPLAASVLDGPGTENAIIPVQLIVMAAIGAGVAVALPGVAQAGATTGRRAAIGAGWGLLAAVAGVVVFWFLLNGLGGA